MTLATGGTEAGEPTFLGYRRPYGTVGVRNAVLIVPTVICAAVVAERIAAQVSTATALPHQAGCGQLGPDRTLTQQTLTAYARHPNVGAVLVIALGCEQVVADMLVREARQAGKPADAIAIQEQGGTLRTIERGIARARALEDEASAAVRVPCQMRELTLALKCGGSDFTSGLTANPVLGDVADRLVDLGGAVVLGEVAEMMGAESLLLGRASEPQVGGKLLRMIERVESQAVALGLDLRGTQPSPGNIRGGLTTIEEKALGATQKGGTRAPLVDVVPYAGRIARAGLTVMDTPGLDVESVTGLVGGGAQVVVFTTGLGTPTGNPIAPVVKITGNARTAQQMADNIDLDVSQVLSGEQSREAAAARLFDEVRAVASGRLVAAERLGHREFAIHRSNPTI